MYKAVFCALMVLSSHAFAEDGDDSAMNAQIKALCDQGIEGSAKSSVPGLGDYRMNLICIDDHRMMGTAYNKDLGNANLVYSAVEHDTSLELAEMPLSGPLRNGIASSTSLTMAHIDIPTLMTGKLEGWYINGNLTRQKRLDGVFDQTLPQLSSFPSFPTTKDEFNGTYALKVKKGGLTQDAEIFFYVSMDHILSNMRVGNETAVPMVDGPKWDNSGRFKVSTSSGETVTTGKALWHVRGYVSGKDTLQIWWVNSAEGISGPYTAKKVFSAIDLFPEKTALNMEKK